MNTRHSDTQLEHRKAYLKSKDVKYEDIKTEARAKIPQGVGRDKQWYSSGQFWGKNYLIGLILRTEKFRVPDEDKLFELRKHSPQYAAWVDLGPKKRKASESPVKPVKKARESAAQQPVPVDAHTSSSSTVSAFAVPEEAASDISEPVPSVTKPSVEPVPQEVPVVWQRKAPEEYVQEYTAAVQAQGYQVDTRTVNQQRADKAVSIGVRKKLLYQQKHALNEEVVPPAMGCLFPVWYKGNSQLSSPELKAIYSTRKAAFATDVNTNTSYKMTALDMWTAYCREHHDANLSCTLDKILAFCVFTRDRVMADASKYNTPDRVFQNTTREVMWKLLWHHGYVGEKYDPMPLLPYSDLKAEVKAAEKERLGRKTKFADDYKINEEAATKLNHAPFDLANPVQSLQLGMMITLMYGFIVRPHQSTLITRANVGTSRMEGSTSFGASDTINIVTRCINKSGNKNPEQLFAVKTFDPRCFSMDFWMALNDVYTNDVRLPNHPYVCKQGSYEGRPVNSLVQMTAEGLTDAVMERHPIDLTIEKLGEQVPVFERIPLVPHAKDLFRFTESAVLNQSLVRPCLERLGMKGEGTTAHDVLSYMLRTARICQVKSAGASDEDASRVTKHFQGGQSLSTTTYGARVLFEALSMLFAGYDRVDLMNAQSAQGWKNTNVPTFELLDREYCQEQGLGRFAELVDQLVMPGAELVSQVVCELQGLTAKDFAAFKHQAHVLAANKWKFIQLAPLFYDKFKTHQLFTDLPFFKNEGAVRCDLHLCKLWAHMVYTRVARLHVAGYRLFQGSWTQMVLQKFAEGRVVYRRLCYEGATRLLDTVADRIGSDWQGGSRGVPGNNAQKRQLMTALLQCIAEEDSARSATVPAQAVPLAPPSPPSPAFPVPAPLPTNTVSAAVSQKLVIDGASLDAAGIAAWISVYLNGYSESSPFIKYYPVRPSDPDLPDEFRPAQEKSPGFKEKRFADLWDKRRHLAFEVCRQASALQQAVNAKVPVFEARRKEKHGQSKTKYVERKVNMDLRTAVSKVTALLQNAIQANRKNGCHPQSIETLSRMFKDLRAGQEKAKVHRSSSKTMPPSCMPASSLQGWLCIASSSNVDAMVAELYA